MRVDKLLSVGIAHSVSEADPLASDAALEKPGPAESMAVSKRIERK